MDETVRKLEACHALSIAMRQAICLHTLAERELRLANWLILETYDRGEFAGRTNFHEWARVLGFWDSKSVRPKQCMQVFIELKDLGLLDWNQAEGTYELRPYQNHWTGLRQRGLLSEPQKYQDLALRAERPLSEALSEVSREEALNRGPDPIQPPLQGRSRDWPALYKKLREGLSSPEELERLLDDLAHEQNQKPDERSPAESAGDPPAKNAGGYRRKMPVTQDAGNAQLAQLVGLPAKNAGDQLASSIASSAPVSRAKLAIGGGSGEGTPAKNAGEIAQRSADAWRLLQSVDRRKTLSGRFADDYEKLCQDSADYVLGPLWRCFEEHEAYYQARNPEYRVRDPVGWMGRKAAEAGRMRWQGKRK